MYPPPAPAPTLPLLDAEQKVVHPSPAAIRDNWLTVLNIRNYLDRLPAADFVRLVCSLLILLPMLAHGGAAYIAADIQANIKTIRLFVGTSPGVYSHTNVFAVPISANGQTVTNLISLSPNVTNYVAADVIGVNNLISDLSTNLVLTVPGSPIFLRIVP